MLQRPDIAHRIAAPWSLAVIAVALLAPAPALHAQTSAPRPAQANSGRKPLQLGIATSGVIEKILVADGDHVEAGQLLLRLDCRVAEARAEEAGEALKRLTGLTEGVSVTRAQIFLVEREARVTAAQLEDSRKKLALLRAGSRPEDIAEAEARRDAGAANAKEAKAEADQCSLKAPVPGVVQIVATLGQFVSVAAPATLVQLTPDKPAP